MKFIFLLFFLSGCVSLDQKQPPSPYPEAEVYGYCTTKEESRVFFKNEKVRMVMMGAKNATIKAKLRSDLPELTLFCNLEETRVKLIK